MSRPVAKKPRAELMPQAQEDYKNALRKSGQRFDKVGKRRYRRLLEQALFDVVQEPDMREITWFRLGSDDNREVGFYHVRHSRIAASADPAERVKNPRHTLALERIGTRIVVLAIPHDAQDHHLLEDLINSALGKAPK